MKLFVDNVGKNMPCGYILLGLILLIGLTPSCEVVASEGKRNAKNEVNVVVVNDYKGFVGRIFVGGTLMSLSPPNFDNDKLRYLTSDFYFVEPQKIISGKNIIVQLWPCNAGDIDANFFDIKQIVIELPIFSTDSLVDRLWILDNKNARFVSGNNFQGLGRIDHRVDGEMTFKTALKMGDFVVEASFKGISKNASDGVSKPTEPLPFMFKLNGILKVERSIESMNKWVDCRGLLGIKIPEPCKKGELCVMY